LRSSRSNFVDLTRFYAGIENDYNKSGVSTGVIYDVSSAPQDLFTSGRVHCDTAGNLRWETALLNNGGSQINGVADGATLVSHGDGTMTGGGSSEKCVINAIFGTNTITDVTDHVAGLAYDTISLSRADFAKFAAVLSSATHSDGDTVLTTANGAAN
jgi:hypothetical protein